VQQLGSAIERPVRTGKQIAVERRIRAIDEQ
jgi:hypothetical protein